MRLFSSKKICIMIASAGLLFAGVLLGTSVIRQHGARRTFEEEGYILTLEQGEDQVMVNQQNRFAAGSSWSRAGVSSVAFRDENGDRIVVDSDSFIHYDSNSLAAAKDGAISDMDQYLDGVIGCSYLPAGNTLTWDGSSFTAQSQDGEKRFENFIWKNSEQRYLLGSPSFTIRFSGGNQETSENGFLELYYLGTDKKILQLSNGDQAWQVVSKDCTVTFLNGVVLNCEDGSLTRPDQIASADQTDPDPLQNNSGQTMSLQNIEIDASGSIVLSDTQSASFRPSFRFTLFDGADGASGTDGAEGAPGESGEDGEDGTVGADGAEGTAGADGAAGATGATGGTYTIVQNGGIDPGIEIKTGIPAIIVSENGWNILKDGTFKLQYENEDVYDTIDSPSGKAYVYLYKVDTGEILWSKKDETITYDPVEFRLEDVTLEPDTTYGLVAIDTYTLGGTSHTTKLFERIFTTDSTGITAQLLDRTSDSFTLGIATARDEGTEGSEYAKITEVKVTFYGQDGKEIKTETYNEGFSSLVTGKLNPQDQPLDSNTWYRMDLTINCTLNEKKTTVKKTLDWTTLKQAPVLGGLTLRAESGYLVAKVMGNWDASEGKYAEALDKDDALESITYRLYDRSGLLSGGTAKKEETVTSATEAYFNVDGSLLLNNSRYYVVAEYVWNDGVKVITSPVGETQKQVTDTEDPDINTGNLKGRAFAAANAIIGKGVSLSFNGNGTKLYNLTEGDTSEGTTYEKITGSLMVNLNGTSINVDDTRALRVTVTDNKVYKKTITLHSCDGKQGNIEGSFAIPLDLDGLTANDTYALQVTGYVYDQSSNTYKYQTIGTLTIRTDSEKDIVMGMQQAENGGIGVDFWIGAEKRSDALGLRNYYDQENKVYLLEDKTTEGDADYLAKTNASYRNLSSIVFELYSGSSKNPTSDHLIGTCTIYDADADGNRKTFMPGYSPLYQKYYGDAIANSTDNNVGVGASFANKFEYSENTNQNGFITEGDLDQGGSSYTIKVRVCYDYTYDRYMDEDSSGLYDYYIPNGQLQPNDYYNELTINNGQGLVLDSLIYQKRPVSPEEVTDNGYALSVTTLENSSMGAYNAGKKGRYDAALLDDTAVGLEIKSNYVDAAKLARNVTFYGTTYDLWMNQWDEDSVLSDVRDQVMPDGGYLFDFKFTFPMTLDGKEDSLDQEDGRREDMPHLRLISYDEKNTALKDYLESSANGYTPLDPDSGDRGYAYRKYDSVENAWIIYTSFLQRGLTYRFAYDAVLDYTIDGNNGVFQYPADYYKQGWVASGRYAKNTALSSPYTPYKKQRPQVGMELLESRTDDNSAMNGSTETWNVYLNDPDNAVLADSLLGYNKDYNYTGAIYNGYDNELISQDGAENLLIKIGFKTSGEAHNLQYILGTSSGTYNNKVIAVLDSVQADTENASDLADAKQTLQDLLTAMKKVETDENGKITAGTTITVSGLRPTGIFYSWKGVYGLLDDYQQKRMQGRLSLIEHNYAGHASWTMSSGSLTTDTRMYEITSDVDKDTNDIIDVLFNRGSENEDKYRADMYKIAAVKITAEKDDEPILEKDKNGDVIKGQPKEIWQKVDQIGGGDYGFSFRISDFDKAENGGIPQFDPNDSLKFTYTIYYDNGERESVGELHATETTDENKVLPVYYALKSVNSNTSQTPDYEKIETTTSESNSPTKKSDASQSIYQIAGTLQDADKAVVPERIETLATANDQTEYLLNMQQTYTIFQNPCDDEWNNRVLTRKENLWVGANLGNSYENTNVAEFCKLGTVTADFNTEVKSIAPTLAKHKITAGINQAKVDLTIESFNLMTYPASEDLHLYYALYKVTQTIVDDEIEKTLELAGVMIGEKDQKTAERTVILDQLEKNQTYRLYIYYKDNRKSDAKLDSSIFGSNEVPKAGVFVTGTQAEKLAKCFTPTLNNTILDPASNESVNQIKKIRGYNEVVVKDATYENGTTTPAVLDYYEEFTTKTGIVIDKLSVQNGAGERYLTAENWKYPTGDADEYSLKKLTATATTEFVQNEYTTMFFVLERCAAGDRRNEEKNWKTVLAEGGTGDPTDEEYVPEYPTDESNPLFHGWADNAPGVGMTKNNFRYYGTDYTYEKLADPEEKGEYTASMSLTYYPGQVIVPGYYYRMRAMIFQYEEGWTKPQLVSLAEEKSEVQYLASNVWFWQEQQYDALNPPVKITNIVRGSDSIQATVKATSYGFYLDQHYYVRLCKWNKASEKWEILEDGQYYGLNSSTGESWNHTALLVNGTYILTFTNLENDTDYQLRFYGLLDSNYDNHLNIAGNDGTPLQQEYDKTSIYANLDQYQKSMQGGATLIPLKNNLSKLYTDYLKIGSYNEASKLNIAEAPNADKVLLNSSSKIHTFDGTTAATIGEYFQTDVDNSRHQLKMYFVSASGLNNVDSISYTVSYYGDAKVDTVSGQITRQPGKASLMDDEQTYGDVQLTITNDKFQLSNIGTYYIQLELKDEKGVTIEKTKTYTFGVY